MLDLELKQLESQKRELEVSCGGVGIQISGLLKKSENLAQEVGK